MWGCCTLDHPFGRRPELSVSKVFGWARAFVPRPATGLTGRAGLRADMPTPHCGEGMAARLRASAGRPVPAVARPRRHRRLHQGGELTTRGRDFHLRPSRRVRCSALCRVLVPPVSLSAAPRPRRSCEPTATSSRRRRWLRSGRFLPSTADPVRRVCAALRVRGDQLTAGDSADAGPWGSWAGIRGALHALPLIKRRRQYRAWCAATSPPKP